MSSMGDYDYEAFVAEFGPMPLLDGATILTRRVELGRTLDEAAADAGMEPDALADIERGGRAADPTESAFLFDALDGASVPEGEPLAEWRRANRAHTAAYVARFPQPPLPDEEAIRELLRAEPIFD
jgi:transcriptional regulator with XRE-family HTH domain